MVSIISIKSNISCKLRESLFHGSECNLFLYADDTCLVFQSDNVQDIKKQLNPDFAKYATGLLTTN